MSPDNSDIDRTDASETSSAAPSDESTADESTADKTTQEMNDLLEELRAEVTRLRAQQAKKQAESWVQRHPFLALTISSLAGAAAGYGAARATRPQPPSLSERARGRLRRLADEAQRVATGVGKDLSERAARSGEGVRNRAEETGRRLADQAQKQGAGLRKQAEDLARRASEQARRAGTETGETVRQATAEASDEARELGARLADEAEDTIEEQVESAQETLAGEDESSALRQSIFTVAGLAAGGYLAAKVRRWL
ncbi:hypothetical protein [Salinibacter sp.]|uniref:hypothetical protein n=1 Tax=Salinibacter sp. TaxID=2065818 RepID=UPI0021E701FE|nr:hypothetical protein [Salinibacter sp.]